MWMVIFEQRHGSLFLRLGLFLAERRAGQGQEDSALPCHYVLDNTRKTAKSSPGKWPPRAHALMEQEAETLRHSHTHTRTHARTHRNVQKAAGAARPGAGQSCQSRICPAKAAFVLPSPLRLLLPSQGFVPSFRGNDWWRGGPQTSRLLPSPLLFPPVGFLSLHVVYSSPKHCHRVQGPELP